MVLMDQTLMHGTEADVGDEQVLRHEQGLVLALVPKLVTGISQASDHNSHRWRSVQRDKRSSIDSILVLGNGVCGARQIWILDCHRPVLCDVYTWHWQPILLLQVMTTGSDSREQPLSHYPRDQGGCRAMVQVVDLPMQFAMFIPKLIRDWMRVLDCNHISHW